jgi:hypothetical protein
MTKLTSALSLVVWLASLGAGHAQEMPKPLGKWERKIGKSHVTLTVEENRLHATFFDEKPCTLHADYCMTKDGVLYGVITSIEYEEDDDCVKSIFDAPFSCRYRIDEGALIIRDLKCHEVRNKDDTWNGRFKAVAPVPARISGASYPATTSSVIPPLPSPSYGAVSPWPSTSKSEPASLFYSSFTR